MMEQKKKCQWCQDGAWLEKYHDEVWGLPEHDDRKLFGWLLMEAMSCGLSWVLMLKKQRIFEACFADFDYDKVAAFNDADVERILNTEGMIRSKSKIEAMIANARTFVAIRVEFGSFDAYIWRFSEGKMLVYPAHQQKWAVSNDVSVAVAKDLKKRGFKYLGPVIVYSYLQAIGIINDHEAGCYRYHQVMKHAEVEIRIEAPSHISDS